MAALTDLSDLINRLTGGNNGAPETVFFTKLPYVAGVAATAYTAGRSASLWTYDGFPARGSAPGAGAIPTVSTAGAIPFTASTGGRDKQLISIGLISLIAGTYLLYDRLYHISGLSGTSTSDQTIQGPSPSPALTRNTGGAGNIVFYEIYTAIGGTATTLTMTYTNQAGTGGQTTTIPIGGTGFNGVTRAQRLGLAAGDSGVRAVEKIALTATTGTVGNFGITIAQPLAWLPIGGSGTSGWRDYTTGLPGIPVIDNNACLALMFYPTSSTVTECTGAMTFVEK